MKVVIHLCTKAGDSFSTTTTPLSSFFPALTSLAQTLSASVILHTDTRSGGNIYGMLLKDNLIGERQYAFAFRFAPIDEKRRQDSSDRADLARAHQHCRWTFVEVRRHQSLVLPAPTGPYAVGRIEYDWTDQSRYDPLAPHAGLKRELVVWAWYPALREPGAQVAPYLPSKWAQLSDEQHGFIGQQLLQSNGSIETHSLESAPLAFAAVRYPVLIFEPGLGTIPTQYTTLLEHLASHGYIIFAIHVICWVPWFLHTLRDKGMCG